MTELGILIGLLLIVLLLGDIRNAVRAQNESLETIAKETEEMNRFLQFGLTREIEVGVREARKPTAMEEAGLR